MGLLTGINVNTGKPQVVKNTRGKTYNFSKPQQKFIAALHSELTGSKEPFLAAWVAAEVSAGTEKTNRGNYNYLNVGMTDTRDYGTSDPEWKDPVKAGIATGKWAKGEKTNLTYSGSKGAAKSIQNAVKAFPGKSASEQAALMAKSGWASGSYPTIQKLLNTYKDYETPPGLDFGDLGASKVEDAVGSAAKAVTSPLAIVGKFYTLISSLFKSSTWFRIGKVLLGLALVLFAVSKATGMGPTDVIPAGKVAKAVAA